MAADLKSVAAADTVLKLLNQAFVQMYAFAADFANEVVVVLSGGHKLIAALAVA